MTQIAYTDGSLAKCGGWAAVIRGERNYEIAGHFDAKDSYEAELCAVYKVLEQAEGKISIVCDCLAIVNKLKEILKQGAGWHPPEERRGLWLKVMYEAQRVLEGVKWAKCDSLPEQRIAHRMANAQANTERGL